MSAWIAAIAVIIMSVVFAFGFGFIALFAGTLGGFHQYWLGENNYLMLFFSPLIAIALLYALQPFIGRFAAPVTGGDRAASAFAGIAVGMPFTCTVAGMLWPDEP